MKLIKKEILKEQYERWDLSVKKYHNYIIENCVVHNSNSRMGIYCSILQDGTVSYEWKAGSHKVKRKMPSKENIDSNIYWFIYNFDCVKNMLTDIMQKSNDGLIQSVTIYGEVYGRVRGGHKSLHYGKPSSLEYAAFDIMINGEYIDYEEFKNICETYDIPTVPVVAIIPFNFNILKELSKGNSFLAQINGADHIKEGIVVKALKERTDPKVGRVILKMLNDDYLILKNKAYEKGEITDFTDE
jgi:hypothetical protein